MWMRSLNGESDGKGKMKEKLRLAVFWPQKVVERGRRGDRGKRALQPNGTEWL